MTIPFSIPQATSRRGAPLPLGVLPLGVVLLAAAATAQDATAPAGTARALPAARVPVHSAASDQGVAYGLWAAGADYKASFHDGMVYVPYLGATAPANVPLRWRTHSVTLGGVELVTRSEPARTNGDWRVVYDHGGVVEAYDVRLDGLEQTFVVAARPAGASGDLVVCGCVETTLRAANVAPAHQELAFVDAAGRALVTYGAATAVDAAGRRQPMTTRHEDGQIELRLDAAWLEAATFPVVVDPLLGPTLLSTGLGAIEGIDVVRDDEGTTDNVWTTHERYASASDSDVYGRRSDDDGTSSTLIFQDVTASWSSTEPTVAFVAGADRAVIAFTRDIAGPRYVRVHWHDRADLASGTGVIGVNQPAAVFHWRPALGGCRENAAGTHALLAMQRETTAGTFGNSTTSEIVACAIDLAGGVTLGPVFVIADTALTDHERPALNRVAFDTTAPRWLLAYQRRSTIGLGGNSSWDVVLQKLDAAGNLWNPQVLDAATTSQVHEFAPQVAGGTSRFLVSFVSSTVAQAPIAPSGRVGHAFWTSRVDWPRNTVNMTQPWPTSLVNANTDARVEPAGIAFDNLTQSHWAVMFRSTATENVYLRSLGYHGDVLRSETPFAASGSATSAAGGMCFDDDARRHVLVYGNGVDAMFDRFEYAAVTPWSTSGISCSAATIAWQGSQQIGGENGTIAVTGAPGGCVQFMALALATASQPLVGIPGIHSGCWLSIPNTGPAFLGTLDVRFGSVVGWNLPLPEFLANDVLYAQGFHTDATLSEIYSTQRLVVPVGK